MSAPQSSVAPGISDRGFLGQLVLGKPKYMTIKNLTSKPLFTKSCSDSNSMQAVSYSVGGKVGASASGGKLEANYSEQKVRKEMQWEGTQLLLPGKDRRVEVGKGDEFVFVMVSDDRSFDPRRCVVEEPGKKLRPGVIWTISQDKLDALDSGALVADDVEADDSYGGE